MNVRAQIAKAALALALSGWAGSAYAAPTITDGSFETPALGAGGYAYQPTVAGTTFNIRAGIASNGSPFVATASDGVQAAFLQSTVEAVAEFSLDVTGLTAGTAYFLNFDAARRAGYAANIFTVAFDGVTSGTFTPLSDSFSGFTTAVFNATGETGTLTFRGSPTTTGDNNSIIDNLRLTAVDAPGAVPEPATWALMLSGIGAVGGAMRRRRQAGTAQAFA